MSGQKKKKSRARAVRFPKHRARRARNGSVGGYPIALGRRGLADMIERNCRQAAPISPKDSSAPARSFLNDVVLTSARLIRRDEDHSSHQSAAQFRKMATDWCGVTECHRPRRARCRIRRGPVGPPPIADVTPLHRSIRIPATRSVLPLTCMKRTYCFPMSTNRALRIKTKPPSSSRTATCHVPMNMSAKIRSKSALGVTS